MAAALSDNLTELSLQDKPAVALDDAGDLTCPVCLEVPEPADMALIKGCEHLYCVNCILKWACARENATCPSCKAPFSYLFVHRQLDGTITDYPTEESLCLLKRAEWFTEHVRVSEFGPRMAADDEGFDDEDEYGDDEDEYYGYAAPGRARIGNSSRIVIGNRRWGENGSVRAGRMYARPANTAPPVPAGKGGKAGKGGVSSSSAGTQGGGSSSAGASTSSGPGVSSTTSAPSSAAPASSSTVLRSSVAGTPTAAAATPAPASATAGPSSAAGGAAGASSQKQGRRAKRAARRAAADLEDEYGYDDRYDHYDDCY
mmetsp:Transcript_24641/g.62584  ORF Transcript_24641/g.62584 Transcript_24641/m.62584 type:complete len:315 (-) Transcript_24641:429-1373(-)|eukprot:CAMPEP_0202864506 /NCGR_PEP_ID=MMETSP1391-20130828/4716_1 /ASSEMBLY_ACC=CAM_ASM_000867 /TAXON_ID=1034604 /ORGANISM="Chlamydomonas leiostraca, Strain SAG 11-49" /LENGTH=314 /DNA_ID=CAMNT_0049544253 /DNA_START=219 /DNA_END=1163 /DNA_ORIENTATION=+